MEQWMKNYEKKMFFTNIEFVTTIGRELLMINRMIEQMIDWYFFSVPFIEFDAAKLQCWSKLPNFLIFLFVGSNYYAFMCVYSIIC